MCSSDMVSDKVSGKVSDNSGSDEHGYGNPGSDKHGSDKCVLR
jgi:hypothetical protein